MNRSLIVTGSYKGITGHDHHTRSIVRALHQRGIKIELRDFPGWSPAKLPALQQEQWYEQLNEPVQAKAHLHFCMPHQVQTTAGLRNVNYTMFEANRIPKTWVEQSEQCDLIVVPVESCRQSWVLSGVPEEKVVICPLGVEASAFAPGVKPLSFIALSGRQLEQFRVRFLNVSDVVERKNLLGLLRAWLIATNEGDDAALLLKPGFHARGSRARFFLRLQELEAELRKPLQRAAPIFWINGALPPDTMPSLYGAATHYISLSRGEGFDLPMLEAGVSGLQLIAPGHTAYLDYLNDGIAYLIPAMPQEVKMPDDAATAGLFAGAHWWEPDQGEACALIRGIIDGRVETKQSGRATLSKLSWSQTAERLERLLFT